MYFRLPNKYFYPVIEKENEDLGFEENQFRNEEVDNVHDVDAEKIVEEIDDQYALSEQDITRDKETVEEVEVVKEEEIQVESSAEDVVENKTE